MADIKKIVANAAVNAELEDKKISDETIKMINKINTLLSGTQTNYKYINLQTLKNDYNVKLAQIAKKYRISLGNFRAFVVFEQIFKTNSKKKK
jgi:cellobiose-specific phosphotransferase system component IIB